MIWLAALGWSAAIGLATAALGGRRRLERVARAEHEIRGPIAALALGFEQVRRGRSGAELAETLEAQLERSRAGLADLSAALDRGAAVRPRSESSLERLVRRTVAGWAPVADVAGRQVRLDWRAGPATVELDRGRLAQALGNLLSNAIEHGAGEVEVCGRRSGGAVRIEVSSDHQSRGGAVAPIGSPRPGRKRGRGLGIAASAVEEAGGSLQVTPGPAGTTAVLELPLAER